MASENVRKESPDGEVIDQIRIRYNGRDVVQKDRVAESVREMRPRAPISNAQGLLRHPSTFTEEEINYVVDCLKQNIPVYVIANMIQCERHTLAKLIHEMPELKELKEAKYENILDQAEFQLDRLNRAGNSTTIIYTLQSLGWKRGWGGQGSSAEREGGENGGSRIVMGVIPEEEVKRADEKIKELTGNNGGSSVADPLAMAMMEDKVKEEVGKAVEAAKPESIDADYVSNPPYGSGEGVVEGMNKAAVDQFSNIGGYGQQEDPWASGGDSMFFQ